MTSLARHRVLVTGAGGQLGSELLRLAPGDFEAAGLSHDDCDITDPQAVDAALDGIGVLINAAAYTAVDRAEEERELATAVNARAPGLLARACAERGIRLLHISTDFVFDGRRSTPYPADAVPAPLGVYGHSKLAGERAVLDAGGDSLVVRTGWLYSPRGHNFLRTMLRLHGEREEISVVADQVGTPTAASSLAAALWAAAREPALGGIYHWSNAGVCSWYDFALAIGEEAQALGLLERAAAVRPIVAEDYPTAARRPAYSVLDNRAMLAALGLTPVHWRVQLRDTLTTMRNEQSD